jgi:Integrase core domain
MHSKEPSEELESGKSALRCRKVAAAVSPRDPTEIGEPAVLAVMNGYAERLAELGAVPSIGSVGDAYDSALAEAMNGACKSELIRGPGQGPWRTVEDVELATLSSAHWHNIERLHENLGYRTPEEVEVAYAAEIPTLNRSVSNRRSLHQTQGVSEIRIDSVGNGTARFISVEPPPPPLLPSERIVDGGDS